MPYLDSPIAAYEQISRAVPRDFPLTTADTPEPLLEPDIRRKGHLTKNLGTSEVVLLYGLKPPTDDTDEEPTEIYRIQLLPNSAYLHDFPEIIPHTAISSNDDALIQIIELF
jgi:hypothetical protein